VSLDHAISSDVWAFPQEPATETASVAAAPLAGRAVEGHEEVWKDQAASQAGS